MSMIQSEVVEPRKEPFRFLPGNTYGIKGRPVGARNKLTEESIRIALKLVEEGGETAMRQVMLNEPGAFWRFIASILPQHFKHEVEHTIAGLPVEEVQRRLAASRAKLIEAGVDLEALPTIEGENNGAETGTSGTT